MYVVFECKNHQRPIQERDITDFSDKIGRIFKHAAKGVIVSSVRLQSGAHKFATSRRLGIVKYDDNGMDVVADRRSGSLAEQRFLKNQVFFSKQRIKSMRFAALQDGKFLESIHSLLNILMSDHVQVGTSSPDPDVRSILAASNNDIQLEAMKALSAINYERGPVDLPKLCEKLGIMLRFLDRSITGDDGSIILGSANFRNRSIEINLHDNAHRERFTLGHEIGHFCLSHEKYFLSETTIENDLFFGEGKSSRFNIERLERQANIFASMLLLPENNFVPLFAEISQELGYRDKGHGLIFVDDQRCNYGPYNRMLGALSDHFEVSKQAIEVRLKRMGLVNDERAEGFSRVIG